MRYWPGRLRAKAIRSVNEGSYRLLHGPAIRWAAKCTARRLGRGKPRSLWAATPILTLPLKARADRALGFESHSLVFVTYYISRGFDLNMQRMTEAAVRWAPSLLMTYYRLLLIFLMLRYDVFHFFYDRGILPPVTRFGIAPEELDLLRAAGKRVYGYAYGADVRRREATLALGKWNFCADCPDPRAFCVCDDESGAALMRGMRDRMTAGVAMADMVTYVPDARRLDYWPIDLDLVPRARDSRINGPLRIAHAPNHTHFKGSRYLEAAIETLRAEGYEIEYTQVQGVPNTEVIRLFGEADLVADQFIGGAYGYTALEAMARGKPVLTYVRGRDLVVAPDECPLIDTTPDTLETTLRWLLNHRARLPAIGAQGRVYVEKWHSIGAVAERLGRLYEDTGDFPEAVMAGVFAQRAVQERKRGAMHETPDWRHPFGVGMTREPAFPVRDPRRPEENGVARDA